jgi:ribonuclease D
MCAELRGVRAIGLDSEWRPSSFLQDTKCALLQLAQPRRAYLLDLHALVLRASPELEHACDAALSGLFADAQVLKLVFGLREDFRMLRASYPQLEAFRTETLAAGVCVQELFEACRRRERAPKKAGKHGKSAPAAAAPPADDGGESSRDGAGPEGVAAEAAAGGRGNRAGLSSVCAALLGSQLDKSAQMSDWERRPLRAAQRRYAAIDAHVLLELHDRLTAQLAAQAS